MGRGGADRFEFGVNQGANVIYDFDIQAGDTLNIGNFPQFASAGMSSDGHLVVSHRGTEIKLVGLDLDDWNGGAAETWVANAPDYL